MDARARAQPAAAAAAQPRQRRFRERHRGARRRVQPADHGTRRRLRRLRRRRRSRPRRGHAGRPGPALPERRRESRRTGCACGPSGPRSNRSGIGAVVPRHQRLGNAVADGAQRIELRLAERAHADLRARSRRPRSRDSTSTGRRVPRQRFTDVGAEPAHRESTRRAGSINAGRPRFAGQRLLDEALADTRTAAGRAAAAAPDAVDQELGLADTA